MAAEPIEITVKLAPSDARRLLELAADQGATVEAVAERVLHEGLAPDPFAPGVFEAYLDSIPGYYDRLQESLAQGLAGRTIPLSELGGT